MKITVAGLAREKLFQSQYASSLVTPFKLGMKRSYLAGIGYGISQSVQFMAFGAAFYYGSRLIISNEPNFGLAEMLRVLFAVIFTAIAFGQLSNFMPDYVRTWFTGASL